ncbi:MAG: PQQ-binding-like beta-propeller repeat protein [Dehalococcoidia bacterium]|nr:PQQ-binding-like beta-propeller repeat protein [Dehalococcoidia bacterium]
MNLRRAPLIGAILLCLPVFAACVRVTNPDGWAAPVIDGQDVYVSTSKGHISAVTLQDGDAATARWTFPDKDRDPDKKIEPEAIYGDPVIDGDRVYLATFSAGVFALNKADGRPVWPTNGTNTSQIKGNLAGGVALANGILYFGTTEGRLYAWNASDGSPAWPEPKRFDRGIWATPVVAGDNLFVATMGGEVHALSPRRRLPGLDRPLCRYRCHRRFVRPR